MNIQHKNQLCDFSQNLLQVMKLAMWSGLQNKTPVLHPHECRKRRLKRRFFWKGMPCMAELLQNLMKVSYWGKRLRNDEMMMMMTYNIRYAVLFVVNIIIIIIIIIILPSPIHENEQVHSSIVFKGGCVNIFEHKYFSFFRKKFQFAATMVCEFHTMSAY